MTARHAVAGCAIFLAQLAVQAGAANRAPPFDPAAVTDQLNAIHHRLAEGEAMEKIETDARATFDALVAYGRPADSARLARAYWLGELAGHLQQLAPEPRRSLAAYLAEHEALAKALVFTIAPRDHPAKAYRVLDTLRQTQPDRLPRYANLAAALCVVHDQPLVRRVNENRVTAPEPTALFKYFIRHESRMRFDLKRMPPVMLTWVVDATAGIEEMQWALKHYAGDRAVGRRFFDVEYDYEHLRTGRQKRVTVEGLTLPNIRKYGGVCADQAYFAASVGKAIGVPTAVASGRGGDVAHAWVGYLAAGRGGARWDFDAGRYPAFQGLRGMVRNPQTRRRVPDSYVSLLAESIGVSAADRRAAIAYTAAAKRLARADEADAPFRPDPIAGDAEPNLPEGGVETGVDRQLRLLSRALQRNAGYDRAWFAIGDLIAQGEPSLEQVRDWAEKTQRFTGRKYPDFALAMLQPMIQRVADPAEQQKLWDGAFRLFARRSDLAAEIRMAQGKLWEEQGEPRRAGRLYQDVINRYLDAGPFAIRALRRAEAMLEESGLQDRIPRLYASAWERVKRPDANAFIRQSNWYRIGKLYADRLEDAGQNNRANAIRQSLSGDRPQ